MCLQLLSSYAQPLRNVEQLQFSLLRPCPSGLQALEQRQLKRLARWGLMHALWPPCLVT